MKKTLIALAILGACSMASATYCTDGSLIASHPNGDCSKPIPSTTPPVTTPTNTNANINNNSAKADANANAVAGALSDSFAQGGNASAKGGSVKNSGNSTNNLRNTDTNAQGQGQQQGQGQSQAIKDSGNSTSKSTSGVKSSGNSRNTNTTASGVNGSGNGTGTASIGSINVAAPAAQNEVVPASTAVNTSSIYNDKTIFIPSVVPMTPPSSVGNAEIVKETGACGPLQRVVRTQVVGHFYGFWSTVDVPQGYTDTLADYMDSDGNIQPYMQIGNRMFGHQVTQYSAVESVSGARNVAIGGGSSAGSWGQAGGGASGASQQMVTTIQLRLCEIATVKPELRTVYIEVPPKNKGE